MNMALRKTRSPFPLAVLSLLGHLLVLYAVARLGPYEFTRPIVPAYIADVDLLQNVNEFPLPKEPPVTSIVRGEAVLPIRMPTDLALADSSGEERSGASPMEEPANASGVAQEKPASSGSGAEAQAERQSDGNASSSKTKWDDAGVTQHSESAEKEQPASVRDAAELLMSKREKLSYQVSVLGIPVGSAELEAVNERGDIRITSTIRSNAAVSGFYPVADFAESRLIDGRYIVSRIRQREGAFLSDAGFTLCLRERNIVWVDRLRNRVSAQPLEFDDVLDVLSGFYFLRTQPLEVGKTLYLHIFDSNQTVVTPVEVLRKERLRLPGLREADTIVIRPALPTDGLFRRTGDVVVWLTDDVYRVPVKLETTISFGKVTAELFSAEAEHREKDVQDREVAQRQEPR
jgi:hypothetical protein